LPFFCGEKITLGDITVAPYMARMAVLRHYRNFIVPNTETYKAWHEWNKNVLSHWAVSYTF